MLIQVKDERYSTDIELEKDGSVWLSIEKQYRSSNPGFSGFITKEYALKLAQALTEAATQEATE
jgi:hypothetical protein